MSKHHGITRRRFVQAAAAAALPVVLSRAVHGADAANERIGLGFIGMGTMNRGHLGHFLGQKDVQVVAVCDVDTTRRASAQKTVEERYADQIKSGTYKGCAAVKDFRELLARKDID